MLPWRVLQDLQQAAPACAASTGSYTAAQQLLSRLQSLKEAAEARPKVWLAYATAHQALLSRLVAGLLQWKLVAAVEIVLHLLVLLLPAPEIPKEGIKYVFCCVLPALSCSALQCCSCSGVTDAFQKCGLVKHNLCRLVVTI